MSLQDWVENNFHALQPSSRVKVLQARWIQPDGCEAWLAEKIRGRTLNVCSGMSMVGDVRLDISPKTNRTEYGNIDTLDFPRGSFDTVVCDPPFSYYRRFKWVFKLSDIAKHRFILSGPTCAFYLGSQWKEELYALKSGGRFLRLWYVFDRLDERLLTEVFT